jgi:hypothetical protein
LGDVNDLTLIATFGYDFSLTGWPVWMVFAIGIALAAFPTPIIHLPVRAKEYIRLFAPVVMLSSLWFTRWLDSYNSPFFFYKFYHAQLDVAFIVAYAFGLAFCLDSVRSPEKTSRVVGVLMALIYLALVPLMTEYLRGIDYWYETRF